MVINTLADLLIEIRDAERSVIDAQGIRHAPTIGAMYEGLTQKMLNETLFDGLGLKVIKNSFIGYGQGLRSKEFDIMIIEGEGMPIPYTESQFEVKIQQIIAIIQVKKTLNRQQLEEGFLNLRSIFDIVDETNLDISTRYQFAMYSSAYQGITGESLLLKNKLRNQFSSVTNEGVFYAMKWEAVLPARILLSYDGYKTERGLREAFSKFLASKNTLSETMTLGSSPIHFPNLIISGNSSIIKNNALPYTMPMRDDQWPVYTSTFGNPMRHLIEVIWARMCHMYGLDPVIFGEDLTIKGVNNFLTANVVNIDGQRGWHLHHQNVPKERLSKVSADRDWEPVKLTRAQFHVIGYMCENGTLPINRINSYLQDYNLNVDEDSFIEEFTATGLVYVKDHKVIALATRQCQAIATKDGAFCADNNTGRLSRWFIKNYPATKWEH